MYTFAEDPIFDLEHTKYGQFLTKYIYEGHKKLRDNFDDVEKKDDKKTTINNHHVDKINNDKNVGEDPKSCCNVLKQFLFLFWCLLLCWLFLTVILITSVVLFARCYWAKSDAKLVTNQIRLATSTTTTISATTIFREFTPVTTQQQPMRPATYFPARLGLNNHQDKKTASGTSGQTSLNDDEQCPLTLYVITIILSAVGLVFVIICGVGSAILNKE